MPTLIARRARRAPSLPSRVVARLADQMLAYLGLEHAELSILLVDDTFIQNLNREHRGKDKPTDVLAFPVDIEATHEEPRILGDVVISLPTALRQATGRGRELLPEVRFLLAHGLLHLIGYDHATPAQKRRMDAAARRLVRAAPLPEPTAPREGSRRAGDVSSARGRSSRKPKAPRRGRAGSRKPG
jgi:probable rRNA maturation factor